MQINSRHSEKLSYTLSLDKAEHLAIRYALYDEDEDDMDDVKGFSVVKRAMFQILGVEVNAGL